MSGGFRESFQRIVGTGALTREDEQAIEDVLTDDLATRLLERVWAAEEEALIGLMPQDVASLPTPREPE